MSILPSLLNSSPPWPPVHELSTDTVGSRPSAILPLHRLLSVLDGAIRTATVGLDPGGVWISAEVIKIAERGGAWIAELADSAPGKNFSTRLSVRIGPQVIENLSFSTGIAVTPDLVEGQAVTTRVGLRLDPRHGLSAHVLEIDPRMTPSLRAAAAEKLGQELRALGLYGLQRGLSVPRDIVHLALVCPDASAARGDVDAVLAPLIERRLLVLDTHTVKFEGPAAADNLVRALEDIVQQDWRPRADAVLIVRGGGSATGMADIETRAVAESVARMPMPVVLGIGHAADRCILSDIAWRSCTTPTSAAATVRDLVVGAATTAGDHAAAIAALCRERVTAQEAACRAAADTIRRATFRVLGEQTRELAVRDHAIDTTAARLDEKLLAFDADIGRMVANLHAHVCSAANVFVRHLEDLDRVARAVRERSAFLLVTAERDVACRAAELAQAPIDPVAGLPDIPVVVRGPDGAVVKSAGKARDRLLVLHFHDGTVPVVPRHTAITRSVTDVPAS